MIAPFLRKRLGKFDWVIAHAQLAPWIAYNTAKRYLCYMQQPTRFLYPRPIDKGSWQYDADMQFLSTTIPKVPLIASLDRMSVRGAKRVFGNAKWISRWVQDVYGVPVTHCPLGVDCSTFRPLPHERKSGKVILMTARHVPQKKQEWLVDMMPKIIKECGSVKLVLAGGPSTYTNELRTRAEKLGVGSNVILTELHGEALVEAYNSATVFGFAAPEEDFGLAPIEAMACGTPVVCWDAAGPKETVVDGVTGFRVRPFDLEAFRSRIVRLLLDKALNRRMGLNAVKHVAENYTWERHVSILERSMHDNA
jgi:glycosyltransferase involved in cell wall biosynthesis